jgi:hypothetical protein
MPAPPGQAPAPVADSAVFYVSFLRDADDVDNARYIGTCALKFERGKLIIRGRRYPSERHRQRISHGYSLTKLLVFSVIGIALYPLACTYVFLGNCLLTNEATLEIDLAQVCNVSCDWDFVFFNVRGDTGDIEIRFVANTGSRDASVELVKQLIA